MGLFILKDKLPYLPTLTKTYTSHLSCKLFQAWGIGVSLHSVRRKHFEYRLGA